MCKPTLMCSLDPNQRPLSYEHNELTPTRTESIVYTGMKQITAILPKREAVPGQKG